MHQGTLSERQIRKCVVFGICLCLSYSTVQHIMLDMFQYYVYVCQEAVEMTACHSFLEHYAAE